jgi:hypothetical protein
VYTVVYQERDGRQGRGPEAISQEREETKVFLYKRVNFCLKKKARTMYIDALYRGVGQNFSTPEKYRKPARPIPVGRRQNQRQAETSRDKQRQARLGQTKAKERERTRENQDRLSNTKRARNSRITNPKTQTVPPTSRTEAPQ